MVSRTPRTGLVPYFSTFVTSSSTLSYAKEQVNLAVIDRYRCPERFVDARLTGPLSSTAGYFRFGSDILCYGQSASMHHAPPPHAPHLDLNGHARAHEARLFLPFDPTQIIDNLRHELYIGARNGGPASAGPDVLAKQLYYFIRPVLPTPLRAPLQRIYFRGWNKIPFPRWPLDVTVEDLFEKLLLLSMKATGLEAIPFIWFWPHGASSATIITHDVETASGRDFCTRLMDIDESFGFRSSFQIVPEQRYSVPPLFLDEIRARGHGINVQDLNHDGHLFRNQKEFRRRVKLINKYGRKFGARGFRSGALYRNLSWYDQLEFEYDMSVPNVGHLEAQRGGCCTVFPYFIGDVLELPVTTTQDYSLFHILRDYTLDLWKAQAAGVEEKHGLLSFITHPDYLLEKRAQSTYRALLTFLCQCQSEREMWITTPDEVNEWWRQRAKMALICRDGIWQIEGAGKERAEIAYARVLGDTIVYTWPGSKRVAQCGSDA